MLRELAVEMKGGYNSHFRISVEMFDYSSIKCEIEEEMQGILASTKLEITLCYFLSEEIVERKEFKIA